MSIATGGSSAVGSLSVDTEMVFNLAREHDALALLRRIHHSALSLDLKNYLRDLVFSTRFGDVVPVDAAFTATFASHGFSVKYAPDAVLSASVPEQTKPVTAVMPAEPTIPAATPKPATGFGFQRSAPVFVPPPIAPAPAPMPKVEAPIVPTPPVTPVAVTPAVMPVTPPATAAVTVSEVPATPTQSVATPTSTPAPVSTPAVEPQPPVTPLSSVPAERIAAIKHEVNALVGNPVNLIDVNNEVGREYMNALLDAMKKSLGGTPAQEVERAMARLERSFVDVKKVLQDADAAAATAEVTPSPVEVSVAAEPAADDNRWSAPAEPVSEEPVSVPEVQPPVAEAQAEPELPVPQPAVELTSVAEAANMDLPDIVLEPEPAQEPVSEPVAPAVTTGFAAAAAVAPVETEASSEVATAVEPMAASEMVGAAESVPAQSNTSSSEVITSVAKEKQLRELMEARHAAEAEAAAKRAEQNAHNPLMADDVTRGLTQLLSEWKLFKSSGIFGTGPSGHEHPLYKKIAPLTMAAVLAGRFDGATPEIKRSITDYMNGWRYEEGVTHEVGETFENYLRRVIRHILDKQTAS